MFTCGIKHAARAIVPWLNPSKPLNTLKPRQNGRYLPDNISKCIFLNENVRIAIKISLKFVPKGPINNIAALVQKMACRRQAIIWTNDG